MLIPSVKGPVDMNVKRDMNLYFTGSFPLPKSHFVFYNSRCASIILLPLPYVQRMVMDAVAN